MMMGELVGVVIAIFKTLFFSDVVWLKSVLKTKIERDEVEGKFRNTKKGVIIPIFLISPL